MVDQVGDKIRRRGPGSRSQIHQGAPLVFHEDAVAIHIREVCQVDGTRRGAEIDVIDLPRVGAGPCECGGREVVAGLPHGKDTVHIQRHAVEKGLLGQRRSGAVVRAAIATEGTGPEVGDRPVGDRCEIQVGRDRQPGIEVGKQVRSIAVGNDRGHIGRHESVVGAVAVDLAGHDQLLPKMRQTGG